MITRAQIPTVLDHPVYDADGSKVGDAKHVFFDDASGQPEWVTVKTGLFGTNESFVPMRGAHMVEDHLEVTVSKDRIKDAPNVDVDSGGHLSEDEEHRLYEHYGIAWDEAWQQANDPDQAGWASPGEDLPGNTEAEAAAVGGTTAGRTSGRTGDETMNRLGDEAVTRSGDESMTRSEEEMHVGVERQEVGRARLRKYVVTEEQQQTIPVRREEVRVVREPVTSADLDDALTGPEITEAEHEVTLHAERPVVETRTEPVERVRLSTEEVTEEETVTGTVRKERIETDFETDEDNRRP
ncbi:photosystem reaction center subunit H [Streptomyces sp. M41(2017)]|uniref:DUF2382 domain-containing protein n=1 Tax=Streptomyces sp. M41(2017) TaxID=1955065 RepID=UPI0009BE259F|nr:PRC and DUF2382 domain-containing protein [Streptomyces sp. M41(2017)]OQQ13765.1 photosystem reaction center subunit H [Streptomyces sp. M41(2017)]